MFKIHTITASTQRTLAGEVMKWMNQNVASLKWSDRKYVQGKNDFGKDEHTCYIEYTLK